MTATMAGPIPVGFGAACRDSAGSAVHRVTWSQQYYLDETARAARAGLSLAIRRCVEIAHGVTEAELIAGLRIVFESFESLRSRVTQSPATARVYAGGTILVDVRDAPPGADTAAYAAGLADTLASRPFDPHGEWPVRAAVVRDGSGLRFLVLVISHVAVDGRATLPVTNLLARLGITRTGRDDSVVPAADPGPQPREVAAWEQSAAGVQRGRRALDHAEAIFRRMPAAAPPEAGRRPEYRFLSWRSRAADLAVAELARRTRASGSSVLLAAAMTVDAARDGTALAYRRLLAANRARPGLESAVVPVSQPVPCLVDTAGARFPELVERAATATLKALRHGCCPPRQTASLHASISRERGEPLDVTPTLNYRPHEPFADAERPVTAQDLGGALGQTRAEWVPGVLQWSSTHYLSADVRAAGTSFTLQVDAGVWNAAAAENWFAQLERVLVEAVAG